MTFGIIQIKVFFLCLLFVSVMLYLIREKEMKEGYIIFWFLVSLTILGLMVSGRFLYFVVSLVGAQTPSSAIFFFALIVLLFLNIHYSIKITKLEKTCTHLIQNIAIMEKILVSRMTENEEGK